MKPVKFKESNASMQGDKARNIDSLPVYAHSDGNQITMLISCWRPSLRERISIFLFGRVWLLILGDTQPAVALEGKRTQFSKVKK